MYISIFSWLSLAPSQIFQQEELGDGDPLKSSFYLALQSPECHGTAMVLDNDCVPLPPGEDGRDVAAVLFFNSMGSCPLSV